MLFTEGELGSPSDVKIGEEGRQEGGLGPGEGSEGHTAISSQPYLTSPCKYYSGPVHIPIILGHNNVLES